MSNYQMKTKEYVSRFDYETQQKAVVAIQDLLDLGKDWE